MINTQPKFIKFADLLEKRLFEIPRYQRSYSWRRTQREDMFKDIRKLKEKPGTSHFMATVVGLRHEKVKIGTDEYDVIHIVDGQQRLTTLVILLKVIAEKLALLINDAGEGVALQKADLERELRDLQELLVKPDKLSPVLLQTNHDQSHYFVNFLREGTYPKVSHAKTLADRELLSAMNECKEFVQRWGDPIELLILLKNNLWFILHEITDVETVYTVFEVLNDRGLEVSWLAKLKSRLMEVVAEVGQGNRAKHIDELHWIWGDFYATVGLREGIDTETLRFAATLRSQYSVSKVLNEEDAVSRLMNEVGTSTTKTIEISNWIIKVVTAVNRLQEEMKHPVTKIRHARLLAVSIILRAFPDEEDRKLLDQWEKTSFRIFGLCRKDARTGVGEFVRLAREIHKKNLRPNDISRKIRQIGGDYTIADVHDQVWNADCYNGWEDELRYVLYRYEEHLAEQRDQTFNNKQWNQIWQASAVNSIEHILPQSKGDQANHRLGNLLLLPARLNSKLGDKDPKEKADPYRQTGFFSAGDVAKTICNHGWDELQIEIREDEIINWIYTEFEVPRERVPTQDEEHSRLLKALEP